MIALSLIVCCRLRVSISRNISIHPLITADVTLLVGSVLQRFVLSNRHRPHHGSTVRRSVSSKAALKVLCRRCCRLSSLRGITISSASETKDEEWFGARSTNWARHLAITFSAWCKDQCTSWTFIGSFDTILKKGMV